MQTAALLDVPEPRSMASLPVVCMAATMALGAALPVTENVFAFKSALTFCIPARTDQYETGTASNFVLIVPSSSLTAREMSLTQPSQCIGTANIVWKGAMLRRLVLVDDPSLASLSNVSFRPGLILLYITATVPMVPPRRGP